MVGEFGAGGVVETANKLSQQIFNIAVAEIEFVVEPDGVADDIWRETVAFISIH